MGAAGVHLTADKILAGLHKWRAQVGLHGLD